MKNQNAGGLNTVGLKDSNDFKDRFKAEYYQLKIRYEKLYEMIVKYEAGTLNFEPKCPIELLKQQAKNMGEYLYTLEIRAEIEGIDLRQEIAIPMTDFEKVYKIIKEILKQ